MANKTINDLVALAVAPAVDDVAVLWDTSAAQTKKISIANLLGTTAAEVVAARGTYADLDTRLDALYFTGSTLLVDAAFAGDDANGKRYNDLASAVAACAGGETIKIAPGIYTGDITIANNNITLIGSGAPRYDSVSGRLVGGTIIRGRISLGTSAGITIRDLGVDMFGVDNKDCIGSSGMVDTSIRRVFRNLTLLGNGHNAASHGIYSPGNHTLIENVRVYYCYNGIAVHGSYQNLSNIYCYSCDGNSIILAAKDSVGNVWHINVVNVILEGQTSSASVRAGAVAVTAGDNSGWSTRFVNIANVVARNVNLGCVRINPSGNAIVSNVNVENCISSEMADPNLFGDFHVRVEDSGAASAIKFRGCQSYNRGAGGVGFKIVSGSPEVYLSDCWADSSGGGVSSGLFTMLGLNLFPPLLQSFSLADDTAASFALSLTSGIFTLAQGNANGGIYCGVFCFRASSTPFCELLTSATIGSGLTRTTGALTGTTGTDGKVNVSAHTDGKIYVENRSGSTLTFRLTHIG